jgi:hypothetical protein
MMLEGIKWAMGVTKADVTPKPFPGKTAVAANGGLPEGPGKELVENTCGSCHAVEDAISTRRSERDWKDIIQLMADRGMTASDAEKQSILSYLSKNFGPK